MVMNPCRPKGQTTPIWVSGREFTELFGLDATQHTSIMQMYSCKFPHAVWVENDALYGAARCNFHYAMGFCGPLPKKARMLKYWPEEELENVSFENERK